MNKKELKEILDGENNYRHLDEDFGLTIAILIPFKEAKEDFKIALNELKKTREVIQEEDANKRWFIQEEDANKRWFIHGLLISKEDFDKLKKKSDELLTFEELEK